jgi:nucleotide-binding universal stress UspA family protein
MKTQKEKVVSKTKKPAVKAAAPKKARTSTVKATPSEDEIREKAREIYYERIARGEHGTPEDDWHEAESILKGL